MGKRLVNPREFYRLLHRIADRHIGPAERAFLRAIRVTMDEIDGPLLDQALRSGNVELALLAVHLDGQLAPAVRQSYSRILGTAFREAGVAVESLAPSAVEALTPRVSFRFDIINPEAVRWAQTQSAKLVSRITLDARANIREIVARGLGEGLTPRWMAKQIRGVVGLNRPQARAVRNYERRLRTQLDIQRALRAGEDAEAIARRLDWYSKTGAPSAQRVLNQGALRKIDEAMIEARVERRAAKLLRYRADTIAHSETMQSVSAGQDEAWRQAAGQGLLDRDQTREIWILGPYESEHAPCVVCASIPRMNPDGVPLGATFRSIAGPIRRPGEPHPRCVVGETVVDLSLSGRLRATSKRWYAGEVVILETHHGHCLTCTPNHPILTLAGWVPAGMLNVGSNIVCKRITQREVRRNPDAEHMPARIDQVADAFLLSSAVASGPVPIASEDFHGDGGGSEIAIIGANRLLMDAGYSTSVQHLAEDVFDWRSVELLALYRLRSFAFLFKRLWASRCSTMSSNQLPATLCRRHALPFQSLGFALASQLYASGLQSMLDYSARDAEGVSEGIDGQTGRVFCDDPFAIDARARPFGTADVWPKADLGLLQSLVNRRPANPEMFSNCRSRLAGEVEIHNVLRLDTRTIHEYVYNLEVDSEIYIANGVVTHNCRCAKALIFNQGRGFQVPRVVQDMAA